MRKAITLGLVIAPLAGLVLTSCEKWAPSFRGPTIHVEGIFHDVVATGGPGGAGSITVEICPLAYLIDLQGFPSIPT